MVVGAKAKSRPGAPPSGCLRLETCTATCQQSNIRHSVYGTVGQSDSLVGRCLPGRLGPELPCLPCCLFHAFPPPLSALCSCGKIHLETTTHIAAQNRTLVAPLCLPKKTDIEYTTRIIKKKTQFPRGNMGQTHWFQSGFQLLLIHCQIIQLSMSVENLDTDLNQSKISHLSRPIYLAHQGCVFCEAVTL